MSDHYIIVADNGHLRIFHERRSPGQTTPSLEEVQALDFPAGLRSYTDQDDDMAGRFQGSKHQTRAPGSPMARTGMSIDERLPMKREVDRRRANDVAEAIETFLRVRPEATWDFAAGPALHNAVVAALSPQIKQRLQQVVAKDLVHQSPAELRSQFGVA